MNQYDEMFNKAQYEQINTGGTRKIADLPKSCKHPVHNPPMHVYLENGVYEHVCPMCGHKQIFTVNHADL